MTPEHEDEIKALAKIAEEARQIYEGQSMMNLPDNREDRIKSAQDYALSKARLFEAQHNLQAAIQRIE